MDTVSYLLGKKNGGGSGTTNYNDLSNKPSINDVALSGNKTSSDLGIQEELVSGTNIKTINNESILGSGDLTIGGSSNLIHFNDRGIILRLLDDPEPGIYLTTGATNDLEIYGIDGGRHTRKYLTYGFCVVLKKYSECENDESFIWFQDGVNLTCYAKSNNAYGYDEYGYTSQSQWTKRDNVLLKDNAISFTPTGNYNPATKKYVDDKPTTYSGYDATKTQVLKNINGTLTWVDE